MTDTSARWLYYGGTVLPQNGGGPAGAVAVGSDGRIIAAGSLGDLEGTITPETRRINLNGRAIIPGFFDCHMHIAWLGQALGQVDLSPNIAADSSAIVRLLAARLSEAPGCVGVFGNRYDQNRLPGGTHVTRQDLDRVSREVPVRVEHTSGHAAVVNSRALEMLGINRNSPDPPGGQIVRDDNGEPTGLLLESASWNDIAKIFPEPTPAEQLVALERANAYLLARGVTSASDAHTMPGELESYWSAIETDALQIRVNCMVSWDEISRTYSTPPPPAEFQPDAARVSWHRGHVGQAKLFADGAITTRTCVLSRAFDDMPENTGILMHEPEVLDELIRSAHDAGWQVATHAIGDRAIDLVLESYAAAQRARTRAYPGHRIEHCMLLDDALISRLRRQNVWSIGQPEFITRLADAYLSALGQERADRLSPYATLDERGCSQAFSSDCPVVPGAPLDGILAAMSRTASSGRVIGPSERLNAEAALHAYTASPAYATRTDRTRGTIEPGKWADFAILSRNPLETRIDEWESLQVLATVIGGNMVFGSEEAF